MCVLMLMVEYVSCCSMLTVLIGNITIAWSQIAAEFGSRSQLHGTRPSSESRSLLFPSLSLSRTQQY